MRRIHFFAVCFSILAILVNFTDAAAMEYDKYTVKPADNFWKISKKMKVDFNKLKKINKDKLRYANNFDLIFPGQILLIPIGKLAENKVLTSSAEVEKKIPISISEAGAVEGKRVITERKQHNSQAAIDLHEYRSKLIIFMIVLITMICLLLFLILYLYFWRSGRRCLFTNRLISIRCKPEIKKEIYVGYLTRDDFDKGYYILDQDGNWIINIENIKALASVAIERYDGDVKKNISYKSPDHEIILRWGVTERDVRTLLPEEIIEFERIAC